MSEKRFVVETVEITDCDTDVSRIAKVITDTKETYSYEDLDEIVDKLNEQQSAIESEMDLFEKYKASAIRDMRDYSDKIIEMQKKVDEQQATIEQLRKLNNAYAEKFAKIVNLISEDVVIDDG